MVELLWNQGYFYLFLYYWFSKIRLEMSVVFLLIIISLVMAIAFLAAFIWAVRSKQYEDDYSPSVRILFDDEEEKEE